MSNNKPLIKYLVSIPVDCYEVYAVEASNEEEAKEMALMDLGVLVEKNFYGCIDTNNIEVEENNYEAL
jgi:hypothetical protein